MEVTDPTQAKLRGEWDFTFLQDRIQIMLGLVRAGFVQGEEFDLVEPLMSVKTMWEALQSSRNDFSSGSSLS